MNKIPFSTCIRLIPGLGHLYLKSLDGLFYMVEELYYYFPLQFCVVELIARELAFLSLFLLAVLWVVNLLDLVITIINQSKKQATGELTESSKESERFYIILLSIIPGLGHFQLGLMQRGLTFLVACTGIGSMIIFVALLTSQESFLIFLVTLPVLWFIISSMLFSNSRKRTW